MHRVGLIVAAWTGKWPQAECDHANMPDPDRVMGFNDDMEVVCVQEITHQCPDCGYGELT